MSTIHRTPLPWLLPLLALAGLVACGEDGTGAAMKTQLGYQEPCQVDANCRAGLSCQDEQCLPSGDTAAGQTCTLTAECAPTLHCSVGGVCAPTNQLPDGAFCSS
ncbi:MAG: hypothetical protein RBU37_11235, partial [Myxococcota bacterium]|nr:hypothetical protein [Myxococcota bacterium]